MLPKNQPVACREVEQPVSNNPDRQAETESKAAAVSWTTGADIKIRHTSKEIEKFRELRTPEYWEQKFKAEKQQPEDKMKEKNELETEEGNEEQIEEGMGEQTEEENCDYTQEIEGRKETLHSLAEAYPGSAAEMKDSVMREDEKQSQQQQASISAPPSPIAGPSSSSSYQPSASGPITTTTTASPNEELRAKKMEFFATHYAEFINKQAHLKMKKLELDLSNQRLQEENKKIETERDNKAARVRQLKGNLYELEDMINAGVVRQGTAAQIDRIKGHGTVECSWTGGTCYKRFVDFKIMKKHVRDVHEKKYTFNCKLCTKELGSATAMKRHWSRLHSKKVDKNGVKLPYEQTYTKVPTTQQ